MKNKDTDTVTLTLTRAEALLLADTLNAFDKLAGPTLGAFETSRGILTNMHIIRHRLLDLFFEGR